MKKTKWINVILLATALGGSAYASKPASGGATFAEKEGKTDFFAVGVPSMLKIHGTTSEISGNLTKSAGALTGTFKIPMKTFVTGLALRDRHLKDKTFEVEKYPDATLVLNPVKVSEPVTGTVPFTGKLNFHGVEKAVSGEVKLTASDDKTIQHEAKFEVKLSDFNIPIPEFAGMKIEDKVRIEVNGTAKAAQ